MGGVGVVVGVGVVDGMGGVEVEVGVGVVSGRSIGGSGGGNLIS